MIPRPYKWTKLNGYFRINQDTKIFFEANRDDLRQIAEYIVAKINMASGFQLAVEESAAINPEMNCILLTSRASEEISCLAGYHLHVDENAVTLRAPQATGLFYAVQTLRHLLPPEIERRKPVLNVAWIIPAILIEDQPRFSWRGLMLDCARHFMTKDFIKRYIDLLAYHKMNVFHWHLTDDQGWRIEIKKYPKLTDVGAWRKYDDNSIYGGFYTQDDIREIVAYAKHRYVTIVPEIELPGHCLSALAAYPELSCTGGPFEVGTEWTIYKDIFCAGSEQMFDFLENVLTEVVELFPDDYVHIGGDECLKDRWKKCPKCQKRLQVENLKDENELQSYFIKRIETFLSSKNRKLIGWDEVLEGGLAPGVTVQSWRGMEGAIAASTLGHDAIVSPTTHTYFDYDLKTINLKTVYSFEPVPTGLTVDQEKHILGGECNMWSERAPQPYIDRKMFPLMAAMAEVLWSPKEGKKFKEFQHRLQAHYPRLRELGIQYGKEALPLSVIPTFNVSGRTCQVVLEAADPGMSLRYTLDGSDPLKEPYLYKTPIDIDKNTVLKAAAFKNGDPCGDIAHHAFLTQKTVTNGAQSMKNYSPQIDEKHTVELLQKQQGIGDFGGRFWQGVASDDLVAVIDLSEVLQIKQISSGFMQDIALGIFLPIAVEYSVSNDGVDFEILWATGHNIPLKKSEVLIKRICYRPEHASGRFVRVRAINIGRCPNWHPASDSKAWIFLDQIIVE